MFKNGVVAPSCGYTCKLHWRHKLLMKRWVDKAIYRTSCRSGLTFIQDVRQMIFPLPVPQVSVQQVISLLMASVRASYVRWAPTSRSQDASSASPVEEVSWPSMKAQCPSGTVRLKVRLCGWVCVCVLQRGRTEDSGLDLLGFLLVFQNCIC